MLRKLLSTTAIILWLIKFSFQIATIKNVFFILTPRIQCFLLLSLKLRWFIPGLHIRTSAIDLSVFLSGIVNATQLAQSILEKEAFYILASLDQKHWIFDTPIVLDLCSDHNSLIFLFDPCPLFLTCPRPRCAKSSDGQFFQLFTNTTAFIFMVIIMCGLIFSSADLPCRMKYTAL